MTTEVPIKVIVDTSQAEASSAKAKRSLEDIRNASNNVRGANTELTKSFKGLSQGISAIDGPLGGVASRFNTLRGLVQSTGFAFAGFAVTLAGAGFALRNSIQQATEFSSAMAEVNTLVGNDFAFEKLTKSVRNLSKEFGQSPIQQAKAAYQIISAGATSAAQATDILTASNKLAIGGVTDVATAADGLTTILNAYGESVGTATDVSDALFVAMRAGKTTIGELSDAIGKVAPLAAQTNTSLEELLSAVAALTKGGISTTEAMTGMRAILAGVAKPTKEASELAEKLGINFTATGLQAKGFAGFLQEIADKTGGSTEQLSQLFGGVEALVPILALTGKASGDFSKILEDMGFKAGETEAAFKKMAESPQFVFNQLNSLFVDLSISIGNALLNVIVPATKVLIANFSDLVTLAEALAVVIGARLVGALILSTAKLTINTAAVVANQIAMARLAAAVGGTSTAFVIFGGAATTAARGLAILAGPLAIGVAVGAYFLLKARVNSVTEAFNSFMATMLVVGGAVLKFANYLQVPGQVLVETFRGAFMDAGDILLGFKLDMQAFFEDPLGGISTSNTRAAIAKALTENWGGAVQRAIKTVEGFNQTIDDSIQDKLLEWGKENRKAAEESDNLGTTTEDVTAKLDDLVKGLGKNNVELDKTEEKTKSATEALKEFANANDDVTNAVRRAGERIFDLFADAINDGLRGDLKSWKDYGSRVIDVMRETFGNLSALALAKPVIVPIIGAAAGALGLDADTVNSLGSSFGVKDLASLAGNGSSLLTALTSGLNTPLFSGSGAIGGAIDSVGKLLGIGGQANLPGPTLSGAAGYTGGLSTAFTTGSTLAGFGGTMLSSILGLSGQYSGITGTVGSLAGTALGSAIGMPWLGAFAGGFLGDALGGLFGGSRPHPAANVAVNSFDSLGNFTSSGLNYKHLSEADAGKFRDTYSKYFNAIGLATGSDLSVLNNTPEGAGFAFAGGVDDGTGFLSYGTGNKDKYYSEVTFNPKDEADLQRALGDFAKITVTRLDQMGAEVSDKLLQYLDNITTESRNAEDVIGDINFLTTLGNMFKEAEEPLTQAQMALKAVNDNFDSMHEKATRLNVTLEDLTKIEDKRQEILKATRDQLFQASASDYFDTVSPGVNQFRSLYDNYQAKLKEFNSVGLDTTFIDRTYQVQQERLLQQIVKDTYAERISSIEAEADQAKRLADSYRDISKSLGDAILNLRLSDISPLSTEQRLSEARANFISVAGRASNGDPEAMKELSSLGNQFLAISRDYYASTDEFVRDFELVEKALREAKEKADQQLTAQQQLVSLAAAQIEAINQMSANVTNALQVQQRVTSVVNSALQVGKSNANETIVQGYRSGLISESQLVNQIIPLFNQLGAPKGDGVGGRSLFFESNPAANAAFIQAARAMGIPGFDKGGDVLGNSLFMVGEKRPEIFQAGAGGGKVIPIQNGAEVEQRLIALEKEMRASVRVQQEGFLRLEKALFTQTDAVEKNTQAVRRSGA